MQTDRTGRGPGCCGVMVMAALLMLLWDIVLVHFLPLRPIGYVQAIVIVLLIGLFGAIQAWWQGKSRY